MPNKVISWIGNLTIFASFAFAVALYVHMLGTPALSEEGIHNILFPWLNVGGFHVNFAFLFDRISGTMTLMRGLVSLFMSTQLDTWQRKKDISDILPT